MMLQPVVLSIPTQDFAPPSLAVAQSGEMPGSEDSLLTRLATYAEGAQDVTAAKLNMRLDHIATGRVSTGELLRLQADMNELSVRVQMTVRIADDTGRAIQTLTQRS